VLKKSENDTTWKCSHGCPNDKVACPHLESLLPNIDRSQIKLVFKSDMDRLLTIDIGQSSATKEKDEIYIRSCLRSLGLDKRERSLFMLKYVDGFTLEDILKKYPQYNNIHNVHYALRQIKKKLKAAL